jgi:hypothetical protein
MRTPRKHSTKQLHESEGRSATYRRKKQPATKRGVPPLSLWECGIGAIFK